MGRLDKEMGTEVLQWEHHEIQFGPPDGAVEETYSVQHQVEMAGLRALVHQIATMDPEYLVDDYYPHCRLCEGGTVDSSSNDLEHEPFCLWVMARKLTGVTG